MMNLQENIQRIHEIMGVINETFIEFDKFPTQSLNKDKTPKEKIDFVNSNLTINDGEIKQGINKVYLNGVVVATFVIASIGKYKDSHNDKLYDNSIFFRGGFLVSHEFQNQGIGKKIIETIFKTTNVDNIFLYAVDWQGAVNFWLKIGGEIIYENAGLNLIKISNWYK